MMAVLISAVAFITATLLATGTVTGVAGGMMFGFLWILLIIGAIADPDDKSKKATGAGNTDGEK